MIQYEFSVFQLRLGVIFDLHEILLPLPLAKVEEILYILCCMLFQSPHLLKLQLSLIICLNTETLCTLYYILSQPDFL